MGLFSKKKKTNFASPAKTTARKPIYDKNGRLIPSLEFYQARDALVKPIENTMTANAVRLQSVKDPIERLPILQAIVNDFYSLKTICEQAGPEYAEYFSKVWEHCHNSRNPDFSYIEKYENELNEMINKAYN